MKITTDSLEVRIGALLTSQKRTLALAESCTGGLVGSRVTDVAGSSVYFMGGIMAYSYEAKVGLLGVSWDTLEKYGAVSREVVLEMANGARDALDTDIALSVSGIAGPGGGMPEKPIGTTWIGLVSANGSWARRFCWEGDRIQNKQHSSEAVLQMLLDYLAGERNLDQE